MTQKRQHGYDHDTVEDFLADEYFVSWVQNPDAESDHFWNNWITRHPQQRSQLELAREMIVSVRYKKNRQLPADDYSRMLERVLSEQQRAGVKKVISIRPFLRIAAVVTLLAVFVGLYVNYTGFFGESTTEWTVVNTNYGQKRTLYLPDGTKVMLHSGSSISFPEKFTNTERHVRFSGEGFFEVTRNEEKPFIITSGKFTTRVLGTSFNLTSIEEENDHSVALVTGKVKVTDKNGQYVVLEPDNIAVYDPQTGQLSKATFDRERHLAWKNDILWFENESLPDVFNKLERWYGVNIVVSEGVDLQGHYTGKYKDKALKNILQGIAFTSDLKYSISHKTVTIYE